MNRELDIKHKDVPMLRTVGFISSIALAVTTFITLVIAILTPPISGPFCTGTSIKYPYTNILSRFPKDYYWMYTAMLVMVIFVIYMVCMNEYAGTRQKTFSRIALIFACLSTGVLFVNYFIQVSFIQPSLINGELEAIGILTQYNPHGIFIALEEIGYIFMSISFLFLAPAFSGSGRTRTILCWTAVSGFVLTVLSFTIISFIYGINREYRFEVAVISIDYIVLILLGILSSTLVPPTSQVTY